MWERCGHVGVDVRKRLKTLTSVLGRHWDPRESEKVAPQELRGNARPRTPLETSSKDCLPGAGVRAGDRAGEDRRRKGSVTTQGV